MNLVGKIGAAKRVAFTSFFNAKGTLGVCIVVLVFPVVPRLIGRDVLPLVGSVGGLIRGENRLSDDSDKRIIGDGDVSMLGFEMSLLDHVYVLRYSGGLLVVCHYIRSDIDDIDRMKAPTAIAEMLDECGGGNVGVEQLRIFGLYETRFVDDCSDEDLDVDFGGLKESMFCFES